MNTDSQVKKICKALIAGQRLTNAHVARLTNSTAPATRMSDVRKRIKVKSEWVKRNGKRFLEYRYGGKLA